MESLAQNLITVMDAFPNQRHLISGKLERSHSGRIWQSLTSFLNFWQASGYPTLSEPLTSS